MNETEIESRASFKFGTVSAVDAKTCRVRVRLPDYDNLRTAWLPVLMAKTQRDKHYHLPDIGEHVVVLLDARGEDGLVLGAIYSSADIPPVASGDKCYVRFADGATIEYDRASHAPEVLGGIETVRVEVGSRIDLVAGTQIRITAPETLIDSELHVTGNARFDQNVDAAGRVMDGAGNSNHHSH